MKQFTQLALIGEGAFGCVYKVESIDKKQYAVKTIKFENLEEGAPPSSLREISVLKALKGQPCIVELLEMEYKPKQQCMKLVFPFYKCDLKAYIRENRNCPNEGEIKKIMRHVLTGLKAIHQRRILHRDIKPENILLDENNNAKIADFGLARYVLPNQSLLTRQIQTLWYRAPEVMLGERMYGQSVDIWAAGCIFAEMFFNRPIFLGGESEIGQIYKVFEIMGTPTLEEWPQIKQLEYFYPSMPKWKKQSLKLMISNMPPLAVDLLEKMLTMNPHNRITAKEACLHQYFKEQ